MGILQLLFGQSDTPSVKQIQRATKAIMQPLGDPIGRYNAASRLIQWGTEESLYAALQRFTIQLPSLTIDQQEKEELCQRLIHCGDRIIHPIRRYIRQQTEIRWPCEILQCLLPEEEYAQEILEVLKELRGRHIRDEEQKARLIQHLPGNPSPASREVVLSFLDEENDDVVLTAVEYLASAESEELKARLIQVLLHSDDRPRVKAWVAKLFAEKNWTVRPHTSELESKMPEGFYLTSKGFVRRQEGPA